MEDRIEEVLKRLEERDNNQEQCETTLRGYITIIERQLEDRKQVEVKLRARVSELEEERDREWKGADEAGLHGRLKDLEKELIDTKNDKNKMETVLRG